MYAETTIYEVHACSKGAWRSFRTFNDPNAAVAEAVRLRHSHRFAGIRVTETARDGVETITIREIYCYSVDKEHRATAPAIDQAYVAKARPITTCSLFNGASLLQEVSLPLWIKEQKTISVGILVVTILLTLATLAAI